MLFFLFCLYAYIEIPMHVQTKTYFYQIPVDHTPHPHNRGGGRVVGEDSIRYGGRGGKGCHPTLEHICIKIKKTKVESITNKFILQKNCFIFFSFIYVFWFFFQEFLIFWHYNIKYDEIWKFKSKIICDKKKIYIKC